MVTTDFAFVKKQLEYYREITMSRLLEVLPSKEPRKYLYDLLPNYPERGGKCLRSALCLAICNILGEKTKLALDSAVAIELFHNGFLVHDDIQDESLFRRGQSTFYKEHGVGVAINVGNAINLVGIELLMKNKKLLGAELAWKIFSKTSEMFRQTLEGQALELGWIKDNKCNLNELDYIRMVLKKTSWYTCIYPIQIGSLIGIKGDVSPEVYSPLGLYMGIAFQIHDDVLNLTGDYSSYGKEIYGDLFEGKRTLMLIHLLNKCNKKEKKYIKNFLTLRRAERKPKDVQQILELMQHYGSILYARKVANNFVDAAINEFDKVFSDYPNSKYKRFILELILYTVEREL